MAQQAEALQVILALREWIAAIPGDVVASLPAMPGVDADWMDAVQAQLEAPQMPEQCITVHHSMAIDGMNDTISCMLPVGAKLYTEQQVLAVVQAPQGCRHRIADIRNPLVKSGYMCIDCGVLFSAADHDGAGPPAQERKPVSDEECDKLIAALCPDFSDQRFPGDRPIMRQLVRDALPHGIGATNG